MWILKDNFTKKMYFRGFSETSGLKNYTCNMNNALVFENEDEAGVVSQVMEETAVVMYDSLGYNINKNDLYVVK